MRILAGLGDGPQQAAVLALTATLARAVPGRITLVHAYGRGDAERGQALLEGARTWLAGTGTRTRLVPGPPAVTLIALAGEEQADLIVLGSAGEHARAVAARAPCPLAVAPPGYEGDGPLRRVAVAPAEPEPTRAWAAAFAASIAGATVDGDADADADADVVVTAALSAHRRIPLVLAR